MQTVQTAIYYCNENRPSQHQVAASKMDRGHVSDRQFEQRYLLGGLGPNNLRTESSAWRMGHGMGHVIRQMKDPARFDAGLLQGVIELDEK